MAPLFSALPSCRREAAAQDCFTALFKPFFIFQPGKVCWAGTLACILSHICTWKFPFTATIFYCWLRSSLYDWILFKEWIPPWRALLRDIWVIAVEGADNHPLWSFFVTIAAGIWTSAVLVFLQDLMVERFLCHMAISDNVPIPLLPSGFDICLLRKGVHASAGKCCIFFGIC